MKKPGLSPGFIEGLSTVGGLGQCAGLNAGNAARP